MGTSLRNAGLVGTAPLAGSSVTGAAHGESFWARYGWLLAAVWVVFLVFPVRTIAESALGLAVQLLGYGLIALFATVYLSVFYRFSDQLGVSAGGHLRAWPFFVALLLIVTVSIPLLGSDAISFGPFLISFGAYLLSIRAMWVINVLILGISCAVALSAGVNDYVFLLGLLVVLIVVNAVNTALIRKNMAAENLRLDYAILAEQDRMARDVHDALGHSLTAVGLKAQLTERLLDTDLEAARAELHHINTLTMEAMDSIRATVGGLRRTTLAQELISARAALDDAGVTTVVLGNAAIGDPVRSAALSWILREAVTNVLRHAHATTCWISVGERSISIEDDGDSLTGSHEGHGIRGMRERARLTAARCEITESVHGGTRVALTW